MNNTEKFSAAAAMLAAIAAAFPMWLYFFGEDRKKTTCNAYAETMLTEYGINPKLAIEDKQKRSNIPLDICIVNDEDFDNLKNFMKFTKVYFSRYDINKIKKCKDSGYMKEYLNQDIEFAYKHFEGDLDKNRKACSR